MVVLHIVLGDVAVVLDALLAQKVLGIGLLEQCIAHILFVFQYFSDGAVMPAGFATSGRDAVTFQPSGDLLAACALQIFPEDPLYRFRLFRIDNKPSFCILVIAEEAVRIDHNFALLETVLNAQFHILTQGLGFLLGEGRHDRDQNFTAGIQSVDVFLFKIDCDISGFQLSDVVQAIHGVPGKTADGFGNDHVDFTIRAGLYHLIKLLSALGGCCADTVVCEDPG